MEQTIHFPRHVLWVLYGFRTLSSGVAQLSRTNKPFFYVPNSGAARTRTEDQRIKSPML